MSRIMTPADEMRVTKFLQRILRKSSKEELLTLIFTQMSVEQQRVIIHKIFPEWNGDTEDLAYWEDK